MCHVPDTYSYDNTIFAVSPACAAGRGDPDRGFLCGWRRGSGGWVRHRAAWSGQRRGSLDTGPTGATRDRAALSGGAWAGQAADADAAFPAGGCDGHNRRRLALQGTGRGCGRDQGRPIGGELYRDEATCPAGRVFRRALLADPAGGDRRSQRSARPLAGCHAALGCQPRRPARTGRSALAGRAVPVTRQAAGGMGGTP